jgi:hypothetical protein
MSEDKRGSKQGNGKAAAAQGTKAPEGRKKKRKDVKLGFTQVDVKPGFDVKLGFGGEAEKEK